MIHGILLGAVGALFVAGEIETPALMTELVRQAPSAAAVIFVALIFLKHQKNLTEGFMSYMKQRDIDNNVQQDKIGTSLNRLGESCHQFQDRLSETVVTVLEKNAEALDRNTEAFGRVGSVCEHMEQMLSRHQTHTQSPRK